MNDTLAVLLVVVAGVVALLLPRFMQPKRRCPHCNSTQIREVARENVGVSFSDYDVGHGLRSTVQQRYKVTRQCNQCQGTWSLEVIEAS